MPERLRSGVALAVLCAVVAFCALSPIWEMDVFWHVVVGRFILDHHALPTTNVWSAADPNQPYHPAQWLWEAIAALLDRRWSLEALRLANAAWITATFAALFVLVRKQRSTAVSLLACALVFAAFHDRVRVRPHVVNLTGELLVTFFILTVRKPKPLHYVLGFVAFFVWSSLHAGGAWMVVAMLAGLGLFVLLWERNAGADSGRIALLLFALVAGVGWLASPGSTGWIRGHEDAAIGYVEEWRAWPAIVNMGASKTPHVVLVRLFLPAAVIGWIWTALRWRKAVTDAAVKAALGAPRELVWALGCIVLGASAWRFFYFAAIAGVALMLGLRRIDQARGVGIEPTRRVALASLGGFAVIALLTLHYECIDYPTLAEAWGSRSETVDDRYFPTMGTQLLVESELKARVATLPNWGGYVTYQGFPRLTSTIDGRFCAPDDIKEITRRLLYIWDTGQHTEMIPELVDQLPADFLLVPRRRHTARITLPNWAKVATGPVEDLWIRRTPGSGEWLNTLRTVIERHRLSGTPGHRFQL